MDTTPALSPTPSADAALTLPSRPRLRAEILIVLGLSLGQSAVYAVVRFIERLQAETPVGQQTTTLNPSYSGVDWLDLTYQVLRIGFGLMPVALAIYLLGANGPRALKRLGLTRTNLDGTPHAWWRDVVMGAGLAALIGIPGLGLYALGRAIGQSVRINTNGLPDLWWSATVLLASAAVAGLLEEVVVVGYLVTRLQDLGWGTPAIILASALLRGTYHLYQGWPMALGNVVMGAVFAWVYIRTKRLAPLIVAHWLLDAVSFVGPELIPADWLDALNAV
jgi:membrane protease YdiL (CAAX protease family)